MKKLLRTPLLALGPRVSVALVLAGTVALAVFAGQQEPPIAVPAAVHGGVFTIGALALWLGMICALGAEHNLPIASYRQLVPAFGAACARGSQRGWPAAVPLLFLPWLGLIEQSERASAICALLGIAVMCLGFGEARALHAAEQRGAEAAGLSPSTLLSLVFCVCASAWYVVVASRADGSADNDAAYYFGVARHIVTVGRFEEPIVWQYLVPPSTVLHTPFDYWQGLTSILLLPSMWLLGATNHVALLTMALISSAGLFALWYLVVIAAPLRHQLAQYIALITFAMAPAMKTYRFDTESVPVFQLVLLASMAAFARGRLALTVCLAFLLYATRGDGAILCAMIWMACLYTSLRNERGDGARPWLRLLTIMSLVAAAHVALCLWLYGTVTPPAARIAASVSSYYDLLRVTPTRLPISWLTRLSPASLSAAFERAWSNLLQMKILPQPLAFAALMLVMVGRRPGWSLTALVWGLLLAGSGLVAAATGAVFAPHRTLYSFVPLAVLAAAAAIDALLDCARRQREPVRWLGPTLAGIALLVIGAALGELRPYGPRSHSLAAFERDLRALNPKLRGQVVASTAPWSVIAVSDSPSVMIPEGDEATLEAVFQRYGVQWILLGHQPCVGRALPVCDALRKRGKTLHGRWRVVQRIQQGSILALRVSPSAGKQAKP